MSTAALIDNSYDIHTSVMPPLKASLAGQSGLACPRSATRPAWVLDKPNYASERDLALIREVLEGNRELFYELIQPYQKVVFLTAFSILKNEADAEDVAQEAILKSLKALAGFRQEAKFSTWLVQITINESRMRLRKDRRHLYDSIEEGCRDEDGELRPAEFADWREIPSEALERMEIREALKKAMELLSEKYRTVLILRDVQQFSVAETSAILGISEANVKTRLSRARLQMRDALAQSARPRTKPSNM